MVIIATIPILNMIKITIHLSPPSLLSILLFKKEFIYIPVKLVF